jgi:hypothetical protein
MYQADPAALADDQFATGDLRWLEPGNHGRLLDARRTPVVVRRVDPALGFFEVEVAAFEDVGACWLVPLEDAPQFQFAPDGKRSAGASLQAIQAAITRLSRHVRIDADQEMASRTRQRIEDERARADGWLTAQGAPETIDVAPYVASRRGMPRAREWVRGFLDEAGPDGAGLAGMDSHIAASYVSNPHSGDLVIAHLIVAAELGLCSYRGRAVRDPAALSGQWSRERRTAHIVARSGFVQALWRRAGGAQLMIYRGIGLQDSLAALADRGDAVVSVTFSRVVAESHFDSSRTAAAALVRTQLPLDRLFMTFLETAAMSDKYLEAEAVLFGGSGLI